jgi:2-polyprenyl-3-methyl-5-hydroxy-6-metoxy-1,4-benzoquinol methylase
MPDLSLRSYLPEIMDQPEVSVTETHRALGEIDFINQWLGGYHVLISALARLQWPRRPVTIIDVGSGGGGTLRMLATWARRQNKAVKLIGIDYNPIMTVYATEHSKAYANIRFKTIDVFDPRLMDEQADITTNCLFCHHFDEEQLARMLRSMYHMSSQAVIINDLDRHWFAYYAIKILTQLFSRTGMVKYDAPLSVARALTRSEWQAVLARAGMRQYSLRWMWAWRWQIIIERSKENDGN